MRGQEREEMGSAIASVRKAMELLKWPSGKALFGTWVPPLTKEVNELHYLW
jgi:hypothetical protein